MSGIISPSLNPNNPSLPTGAATSDNQTNGSQITKVKETSPTDSTKVNASLVVTYNASNQPINIAKTISGVTYNKVITWTGNVCTAVSTWS